MEDKLVEVFEIGKAYLDGGSIDDISTNVGVFNLVKKLRNPNDKNGFYKDGKRVEKEIEEILYKAMEEFLTNKREKRILKEVEVFNNLYNKHGYEAIKIEKDGR